MLDRHRTYVLEYNDDISLPSYSCQTLLMLGRALNVVLCYNKFSPQNRVSLQHNTPVSPQTGAQRGGGGQKTEFFPLMC